jgi:hypothetical protein
LTSPPLHLYRHPQEGGVQEGIGGGITFSKLHSTFIDIFTGRVFRRE